MIRESGLHLGHPVHQYYYYYSDAVVMFLSTGQHDVRFSDAAAASAVISSHCLYTSRRQSPQDVQDPANIISARLN